MIDDPPEDEEVAPAEEATIDASSREGLADQRKRYRRHANDAQVFWHAVFATPVGRREMWLLLNDEMHAFTQMWKGSPVGFPDPNATWYERGRQDLGLALYHRWQAAEPEGVRLMHVENDPRFAPPRRRRRVAPQA